MTSLADAVPAQMTAAQKNALMAVRQRPLIRARNGWAIPGQNKTVTRDVAGELSRHGLVSPRIKAGRHELVITPTGQKVADILREKAMR